MVRSASGLLGVAALERVVNRTVLPPDSLTALAQVYREMDDSDSHGEGFGRSIVGEKLMLLADFKKDDIQGIAAGVADGTTEEQRQRLTQYLQEPGGLVAEQHYLESAFQQLFEAHKEAYPDRLLNAARVRQHITETTSQVRLLNNSWLTGYTNLVSREAKCLACFRLAMTAVALEQFRAASGKYPATLNELTPNYLDAAPADPFDGQPLRYRLQGAGYLLYSIGQDLKDDGGKRMHGTEFLGDIVFSVTTPPSL